MIWTRRKPAIATTRSVLLLEGWVFVLASAGCARHRQDLPKAWSILSAAPEAMVLSPQVLLVADNQLHNLFADQVHVLRTGLADSISESSIRPVQLDYYGQDFLRWLIDRYGSRNPVVHLGDACDLSCTGEFARFVSIMSGAKSGWVMVPGNHDAYFYGNYHAPSSNPNWMRACQSAGSPMNKAVFTRFYLAALLLQPSFGARAQLAGSAGLGAAKELLAVDGMGADPEAILRRLDTVASRISREGSWRSQYGASGPKPLLSAIAWRIDDERPWRSYVVQRLDLTLASSGREENPQPAVSAILLDTCQYETAPVLAAFPPFSVNAGLSGEVRSDQTEHVAAWIREAAGRETVWLFMGHHPYDDLLGRARQNLDRIRRQGGARVYVSAHSHHGRFIFHEDSEGGWIELSVGSILDWPAEFRILTLLKENGQVLLESPRVAMAALADQSTVLPAAVRLWEATLDEPDDYLGHERLTSADAAEADGLLKDSLLASHNRLIRENPTADDADSLARWWPANCVTDKQVRDRIRDTLGITDLGIKTKLLVELERYDLLRPKADPEQYTSYRFWQALWASKYDASGGRMPQVDDWYIGLPSAGE